MPLAPQYPGGDIFWTCQKCGKRNPSDVGMCTRCGDGIA